MTNWKDFERACAKIIGGRRYPANMGGFIDVEHDREKIIAQCKEVKALSLATLSRLVTLIAKKGKEDGKLGVVFVKSHEGRGVQTPPLVVLRIEDWWEDRNRAPLPDVVALRVWDDDGDAATPGPDRAP